MVSGRVGGAFASKGGREGGCGRRRGVREGWSAWSLGSSSVERAHNLLNGVSPWRCGSRGALRQRGSVLVNRGCIYQGNRNSLASRVTVCAVYLRKVKGVIDQSFYDVYGC